MASDRTRELAKEWLITNFDEDVQVPQFEHLDSLVALLDAFERETVERAAKVIEKWNFMACSDADGLAADIRALAAQPTPEVKK